jgi:hypothetical protein
MYRLVVRREIVSINSSLGKERFLIAFSMNAGRLHCRIRILRISLGILRAINIVQLAVGWCYE